MLKVFHILLFTLISTFAISQTVVDIIVDSPDHTILERAVGDAELAGILAGPGPFTVFAPTDAAFGMLPDGALDELLMDPTGDLARILLYHVLTADVRSTALTNGQSVRTALGQNIEVIVESGNVVRINGALVSVKDVVATNGVVHVLDAVLAPPARSVFDVVENSSVHTTLERAITDAEFDVILDDPDFRFTVFAPTDEAFGNLPMGVLDDLLMDPEGDLARLLAYHVVGGEAPAGNLSNGLSVPTALGQDVLVEINTDGIFVGGAEVIITDILTFNGIVHVIDAVLEPATTVAQFIAESEDHTTLEQAIDLAGLKGALEGDGPFTVFAPTDDAFGDVPEEILNDLLANPDGPLARLLLYHVIGEELFAQDLESGDELATLFGPEVSVAINADGVFINDARVTITDVVTYNGIIHVVDAVILPSSLTVYDVVASSAVHNTLETAVDEANLAGVLQSFDADFTVFAPTDDAFDDLPDGALNELLMDPEGDLARILLYHALPGETLADELSDGMMVTTALGQNAEIEINSDGVFINDAEITITDLQTLNGVVHVIDVVLMPPASTIVDVVVDSDIHTILEQAVGAAMLAGALSDDGPFTLFAPTDEAFGELPMGLLDSLLVDPSGDLTTILQYHVLMGEVLSSQLTDGQQAMTLNGQNITVTINMDGVFINDDSEVIAPDIRTFNGVVHVIDEVLLPDLNTAVRGLEEVKVEVGPNPASDFVQVEVPADLLQEGVEAQLIDARGTVVQNVQLQDRVSQIGVSQYPAGVYFLLLKSENSFAKNILVIQ
ncbi:MAG: fasciclin domain-containing protein [Bacteroidota bacterium]